MDFFLAFWSMFHQNQKKDRLNGFIIYNYSLVSKDHMFPNWHSMEEDKKYTQDQ